VNRRKSIKIINKLNDRTNVINISFKVILMQNTTLIFSSTLRVIPGSAPTEVAFPAETNK